MPITPRDVPVAPYDVCRRLQHAGHQAFVVGGCVRDVLRGREAKDWDVATSAHPDDVQRLFHKTIPTGIQHGTITVLERGMPVEVTTFRGEGGYSDGRRPDHVVFGVTLEEDLSRRDFTMNAVAYDPVHDHLEDPFGGRGDIEGRLIRAVGDAAARFTEDGLRILRAVRFAAVLEFEVDPATEAAMAQTLPALARVSVERVQQELIKLMAARKPSVGLRLAQRTGVLGVILPELTESVGVPQNRHHRYDVWDHTLATVDATEGDPLRRLGALLHDVAKPRTAAPKPDAPGEHTFFRHDAVGAELTDEILRRLKFSNKDRERVVGIVGHHMFWYTPDWTDATLRRFIRRVGSPELLEDLLQVRVGDVVGRGFGEDPEVEVGELRRRLHQVIQEDQALRVTDLAIRGQDVMTVLGVPPSRLIGDVLAALLERVIDDPSLNERERLLALVPEVAEGLRGGGQKPG